MIERFQPHYLQESHCRPVQLWLAGTAAATDLDDEGAKLEVGKDAFAVDAAHLLDARAGHRLLVGDDRQSLVCRGGELARNLRAQRPSYRRRESRARR